MIDFCRKVRIETRTLTTIENGPFCSWNCPLLEAVCKKRGEVRLDNHYELYRRSKACREEATLG